MKSKRAILYLSHDGMMEPLGESQVLAYLAAIAPKGEFSFTLLSFEKAKDLSNGARLKLMQDRMKNLGIEWIPMRYHRRPPLLSTFMDLVRAFVVVARQHRVEKFALIHARSYVMAGLAYCLMRAFQIPFLFDMRGFWVDERADLGQFSRSSLLYFLLKRMERLCLINARAIVSLSAVAVEEMRGFSYLKNLPKSFTVIPTCADLNVFSPNSGELSSDFLLGYVGSTGLWYDFAPVATAFACLREIRPKARLLVLTRDDPAPLRLALREFPVDSYEIRSANREETARAMKMMHATVFFLRPFYSKKASAPTRLAEFLGSGVPCLTNQDTGDLATLLKKYRRIGIAVPYPPAQASLQEAVKKIVALAEDHEAREECRLSAESEFHLEVGARSYEKIYRESCAT